MQSTMDMAETPIRISRPFAFGLIISWTCFGIMAMQAIYFFQGAFRSSPLYVRLFFISIMALSGLECLTRFAMLLVPEQKVLRIITHTLDVIIYGSLQAFAIYRSSVFSLAVYGRFSKVRNLNMAVMILLFLLSTVAGLAIIVIHSITGFMKHPLINEPPSQIAPPLVTEILSYAYLFGGLGLDLLLVGIFMRDFYLIMQRKNGGSHLDPSVKIDRALSQMFFMCITSGGLVLIFQVLCILLIHLVEPSFFILYLAGIPRITSIATLRYLNLPSDTRQFDTDAERTHPLACPAAVQIQQQPPPASYLRDGAYSSTTCSCQRLLSPPQTSFAAHRRRSHPDGLDLSSSFNNMSPFHATSSPSSTLPSPSSPPADRPSPSYRSRLRSPMGKQGVQGVVVMIEDNAEEESHFRDVLVSLAGTVTVEVDEEAPNGLPAEEEGGGESWEAHRERLQLGNTVWVETQSSPSTSRLSPSIFFSKSRTPSATTSTITRNLTNPDSPIPSPPPSSSSSTFLFPTLPSPLRQSFFNSPLHPTDPPPNQRSISRLSLFRTPAPRRTQGTPSSSYFTPTSSVPFVDSFPDGGFQTVSRGTYDPNAADEFDLPFLQTERTDG